MGGTGLTVSRIARLLKDEHGADVEALCARYGYRGEGGTLPKHEVWDGISIFRATCPNWNQQSTPKRALGNLIFTFLVFCRLMVRPRFDIVVVTTAPPLLPLAASWCKMLRRIPFAYILYDLEPDRILGLGLAKPNAISTKLMAWSQRHWLRRAAAIIPIGRCMRDLVSRRYGIETPRMNIIAVGALDGHERPGGRETFRAKHGLTGLVLLYAGNLGRYHDFDTVLKAAAVVRPDSGLIQFVIVGRGAQRESIAKRIDDEGHTNVQLLDFVPTEEFDDMMAACDANLVSIETGLEGTCVPSKYYTVLAAGRPTIALMGVHGEVALSVAEEKAGLVVAEGDVDALVTALRMLRDNPELAAELGANARSAFVGKYEVATCTNQLHAILQRLCR